MTPAESMLLAYLLNSLWQVPLVFGAAWLVSRVLRTVGPAAEHRIWVTAIIVEVILPACALRPVEFLRTLWSALRWSVTGRSGGTGRVTARTGAAYARGMLHFPPHLASVLLIAYAGAAAYFAIRLAWSLSRTLLMKRAAIPLTLTGEAGENWHRLCRLLRAGKAELATSPNIFGPMTVGIRRGMILLPAEMVASLSAEDFSTVIAHELAHISREDFAKSLLYELLALPARYHPLLWLTRTKVAETREMVCDQIAAEAIGGRGKYARSLVRLAGLLLGQRTGHNLHAVGIFDANIFERRVITMAQQRTQMRTGLQVAVSAACVTIGLATCASAMALRLNVSAPSGLAHPQEAGQADGSANVSGGVMAGNLLAHVNPTYPDQAKAARVSGSVVLHALIGRDGTVEHLQVISGPDMLRTAALDAVRQWVYKPYLLNGEPVEVETTITVNFSLAE